MVLRRKHLLNPGLNIFLYLLVKAAEYKLVTLYVQMVSSLFLVSVFLCSSVLHSWKTCCMTASCRRSSRPFRMTKAQTDKHSSFYYEITESSEDSKSHSDISLGICAPLNSLLSNKDLMLFFHLEYTVTLYRQTYSEKRSFPLLLLQLD